MIRNIIAVVAGIVVGMLVNGTLIQLGFAVMTMPEGFDTNRVPETIHLLQAQHYLTPFVAHAAGSFVGTLVAMFIAAASHRTIALILGAIFLVGGIAACFLIPAPAWFMAVDLIFAYIPMALIAWKLSRK